MSHIVIDVRSLQTPNSRERGIGYLTRGWLREFLKLPCPHRVSLLTDPRFDQPDIPLHGSFWQVLPFQSFDRLHIQPTLADELVARERTERFLLEHNADLFHMTSPFESEVVTGLLPLVCRTVATFYDATQVVFPDECLKPGGPDYVRAYHAKLQALRDCDRIVAISRWSAGDLLRFTSTPIERIEVIPPATSWQADSVSAADNESAAVESAWLQRIQQPYLLAVLGAIAIKNVERLVAAYSLLPASLQSQYKLLIVYRIPNEYHRREIETWLRRYAAAERVVFTDYVARNELRSLYQHALAIVHPSLYEGFGMPILDAMATGKPVIASHSSSMPEVVGDAGLLVDPLNPADMAAAMARMLSDAALRQRLSHNAQIQAQRYDWQRSAQAMRGVYERTLGAPESTAIKLTRAGADTERSHAALLGALADVTDRRYAPQTQTKIPGLAWLRQNLTSHLREPYFDIMVERQTLINQAIARRIQTMAWQTDDDTQPVPARIPIVDSPEWRHGERLGVDFFRNLYDVFILSTINGDESQQLKQLRIIARIQQLARMVTYLHRQAESLADEEYLLKQSAMIPMPYSVESTAPVVGPAIAWLRRRLTDRLQRQFIDAVFGQQRVFNHLVMDWMRAGKQPVPESWFGTAQACYDLAAPLRDYLTSVSGFAKAGLQLRRCFHWHLVTPYMQPIYQRQTDFNTMATQCIGEINTRLSVASSNQDGQRFDQRRFFRDSLDQLSQAADSVSAADSASVPDQADFPDHFRLAVMQLLQRLNTCIG